MVHLKGIDGFEMGYKVAPNDDIFGADGKPNFNAAADILGGKTQLYTNAADKVSTQGVREGCIV